jgi:hypothetical protein
MRQHSLVSTTHPQSLAPVRPGRGIASRSSVNQRLGNAETELRVQFTRIAQLQAQLDVVLGALRRSPNGIHA